jgi:serine/threonine protein kinase
MMRSSTDPQHAGTEATHASDHAGAGLDDAALARLRGAIADVDEIDDALEGSLADHPRYRPLDLLGAGGMGTVYRCLDEVLGREVAVKVVRVATPAREALFAARLQAESRILARLEHAGIVPIHDAGTLPDGRVFYVMQRLRGRTLHALLDMHAANPDTSSLARRLDIMERITEAVAFAHGQGVIHRDLKPDNVMVGEFGEVHVTDWGVARLLSDAAGEGDATDDDVTDAGHPRLTAAGAVLGTPGFMAPEQAAGGAATVGPAADVYALGALLVTMLAGRPPAAAFDAAQVVQQLPASATAPPPLRAVALRCLDADPARRYQHAGLLLDELRRYRSGDAVLAHREGAWDRLRRVLRPWRMAIVLVAAYLVMRMVVAWLGSDRFPGAGAP